MSKKEKVEVETTNEKSIKVKNLKPFNLSTIKITKIYNPYFDWWTDNWVAKLHRTFKKFPFNSAEILYNGSKEMGEVTEEFKKGWDIKFEIREQVWNKDLNRFEFKKVKDKIDRDWFKTYKKVFDVEFTTENPVEVETYVKDSWNIKVIWDKFSIMLWSSKLRSILESLFDEITWEVTAKFDWEDKEKVKLEDKYVKIKITEAPISEEMSEEEKKLARMETKYIFSEGKPFKEEIRLEDIPF